VDESDASESVTAESDRVDVEQCQFVQRPRCQCVTACLVACDRSLLDDGDMMSRARQPGGDR
jgi:hypothetical protein